MENLAKVDPKEFGLEEIKASELTSGLQTVLKERELLIESYLETIKLDITDEDNTPIFKALRLQIRDNRTKGIEPWHKANKQFFLTGGRFVDAIKNKEIVENERMEAKLLEAEKYQETILAEELAALTYKRYNECIPFVEDESLILPDLGAMPQSLWDNYIIGLKASFEAKKAEDKRIADEAIEKERLDNLHKSRKNSILNLWQFVSDEIKKDENFSDLSDAEWNYYVQSLNQEKTKFDNEQEEVRLENERLSKLAKKQELVNDKLAKELKEKEELIKKDIEEAEVLKQSELSKGDADKVQDLINDLTALKTKYSFKSAKNVKKYKGVSELLDKVVDYINN